MTDHDCLTSIRDQMSDLRRQVVEVPERDASLIRRLASENDRLRAMMATGSRWTRLSAYDLHCENFVTHRHKDSYDLCIKYGRHVNAEFGEDQACWPCMIRVAMGPA